MAKARGVFALQLALGALGFAAIALALVVGLGHLSFALPATAALLDACSQLLPNLGVRSTVALTLGGLSLAVMARTAKSAVRRVRAARAVVGALELVERRSIGGATVHVFDHSSAMAFCAGFLKPRIYVSTGTTAALDAAELEAVVAHEHHHARKRDPLRIFVAGVLGDGLFFAPAMRRLADRYAALAELAADRAAVRRHRDDPAPLASALLAFESADPAVVGIAPERVDQLLGDSPKWGLPLALAGWAVTVMAGVVALTIFASAASAPVNLPLLVAQSCMVVLITVPLLVLAVRRLGGRSGGQAASTTTRV